MHCLLPASCKSFHSFLTLLQGCTSSGRTAATLATRHLKQIQRLLFGWLMAKKQVKLERSSGTIWTEWAILQTQSKVSNEFSSYVKTGSKGPETETVRQSEKPRLLFQRLSMWQYRSVAGMFFAFGSAQDCRQFWTVSRGCIKQMQAAWGAEAMCKIKVCREKQNQQSW